MPNRKKNIRFRLLQLENARQARRMPHTEDEALPEPTQYVSDKDALGTATGPPSTTRPGPSTSATLEPSIFTLAPSRSSPDPSMFNPGPSTSSPGPSLLIPGPSTSTPGPSSLTPLDGESAINTPTIRSLRKKELYQRYYGVDLPLVDNSIRSVIEMNSVDKLVSALGCPSCGGVRCLKVDVPKRFGFSLCMDVVCQICREKVSSEYSSARILQSTSRPKPFAVNEACVLASLLVGMGPYSFNNFCEHMDLPSLHQKTFNKFAKRIYSSNERIGEEVFAKAASIVRQEYVREHGNSEDILDIAVSFDGSWLTRGHKSLIGIGCVVEVSTGLVIDGHVLSLHCHVCAQTGECIRRENPQRYDRWKQRHIESGECTINFAGTSGMMEVRAAEVLWNRSIEKHMFRYTMVVSDGDSKAYNRLKELMPYGPDIMIEKEECLNHVGKRMGSALRNLHTDSRKPVGGTGHGLLTHETIRKLSIYYTRAIRGNKTVEQMRKAIFASLYHGYSTDDFPQHMYCPPGRKSWCFYNRQMACGPSAGYPTDHQTKVKTPLDYNLLHKHLEPIYQRLSSDALLKRCELKATQNPNESFHQSVWSRCNKESFHFLKKVQFAMITAAAEFNGGPEGLAAVKNSLGLGLGIDSLRLRGARTRKRLFKSELEASQEAKKRRKKRSEAQAKAREEAEQGEGSPVYEAGMF